MGDLAARMQLGIDRYGTPLTPFNGRSAPRDVYEELLDMLAYMRNAIDEFDALLPVLGAAFAWRISLEDVGLVHADPLTRRLVDAVDALRARGDIDLVSSDGTVQIHMDGLEPAL
jgi:hypothetical protein